jgi:hypothetical protein
MCNHPEDWAIPLMEGDELESWKELAEQLRAKLREVFAAKTTEDTRPHYAGYSFREALALALDGGTIPLAYWIRDRHEQLSAQDWRLVAMAVWALQQPPLKQGAGRPYKLFLRTNVETVEKRVITEVRRQRKEWCAHNVDRSGRPRQRVPRGETEKIIKSVIAQETTAGSVRLNSDRIWDLLRVGRRYGR